MNNECTNDTAEVVLFDGLSDDYELNDYKEYCELNNVEMSETDFPQWCAQMKVLDFDDFLANLDHCEYSDRPCIIEGYVQAWNGTHKIRWCLIAREESRYDSMSPLRAAVEKCMDGCEYCRISMLGGTLHVRAVHHDGTNTFTVRMLAEDAEQFARDAMEEYLYGDSDKPLEDPEDGWFAPYPALLF